MTRRHIEVRDVTKVYAGADADSQIHALAGVSLSINDGERVGIIGPNGAGKSTLLQIISGVTPPTAGQLDVKGKVHAILAVGVGMREEATGRENLFLDGVLLGRSEEETAARLQDMIDFSELGEFIDQPVRTYSSGMKAKLGFSSLITIEPDILILDETLSVGDVFFAGKAQRAIESLADKGGIVILVSHALASIEQMCTRTIWIDGGKIRMDGPSRDVVAAFRNELHARQEEDIQRKFGASGAAWSKSPKIFSVDQVTLLTDSGDERQMFEVSEHVKLRVHLSGRGFRKATSIRVWAERNDGLILFSEQVKVEPRPDAGHRIKPSSKRDKKQRSRDKTKTTGFNIEIALGQLAWRPFIYQIHVEVMGPKGAVAHNALTFKLWSDQNVIGGAPVLRLPIDITCQREDLSLTAIG